MDTSGSGDDYGWDGGGGGGRMMAVGVAMGKRRGEEDPTREPESERSGGPNLKVAETDRPGAGLDGVPASPTSEPAVLAAAGGNVSRLL